MGFWILFWLVDLIFVFLLGFLIFNVFFFHYYILPDSRLPVFSLCIFFLHCYTLKCGQGCVGPQQRASKVSLYIMQTIHYCLVSTLSRYYRFGSSCSLFVLFIFSFSAFSCSNVQDNWLTFKSILDFSFFSSYFWLAHLKKRKKIIFVVVVVENDKRKFVVSLES